jgi:thymidylate synthase
MPVMNVSGANALAAWKAGAAAVANQREIFNLITTVDAPCILDDAWLQTYSPRSLGPRFDVLRDVSQTIFPHRMRSSTHSRAELYARYLQHHDRARGWSRNRGAWGTYFERLIRFPPTNVNQLERVISKLNTWQRATTAFVFHLSASTIDTPRRLGGPCWHFGEIIWNPGNVLDLIVVYRNHDFFNKALGNFIGLGQLLRFICDETNKQPGALVCHSVHAYSSTSATRLMQLAQI